MLNTYGYFYQTVAMEPYTLQTKNCLTVLCEKMSTDQISLEDYRTMHSAFNPDNNRTLCTENELEGFKLSLHITDSACCRAQVKNIIDGSVKTVGLITCKEKSDHLYICLLGVEPAFQKQGVAGAFIKYLEIHTKQPRIRLNTVENKKPIYEKLDFKDCGPYMEKNIKTTNNPS